MKTFKLADFFLQIIIIAVCSIAALAGHFSFLRICLLTGGWQLMSVLVHELSGAVRKGSERRIYQNILYSFIGIMAFTALFSIAAVAFMVILFVMPVLAVYYPILCYRETFVYTRRPLSVLK